jgi:enoyl-[acyl-carrier protein] reductase III
VDAESVSRSGTRRAPGRVLITGGTRGIGQAIALELTRHGAQVCVTHRWDSVAAEDVAAPFVEARLTPPRVEQCDASDPDQTRDLVRRLYAEWGGLDSVVSGVAVASPVSDIRDLSRRSLEISLGYTAWPLLDLVQIALREPTPPRRFLALSTAAVDRVLPGYDMAAVAKGALETLTRYLAVRLKPKGICVNVLRLGYVDTESLRAVLPHAAERARAQGMLMAPSTAANAAVALLGGLMDGMTGQVLTVDEGNDL